MARFDLPLDELREYRPAVAVPADFGDFCRRSIEKTRTDDLAASFTAIDNKLAVIDTYDVTFAGFDVARIKEWLHVQRASHFNSKRAPPGIPCSPGNCSTARANSSPTGPVRSAAHVAISPVCTRRRPPASCLRRRTLIDQVAATRPLQRAMRAADQAGRATRRRQRYAGSRPLCRTRGSGYRALGVVVAWLGAAPGLLG